MKNAINPNITLRKVYEELEAQEKAGTYPAMIYYSAHTLWWTHRPEDLQFVGLPDPPKEHPDYDKLMSLKKIAEQASGIPTDPEGSPLYQTDNWRKWFASAKSDPSHYGMFGLAAFMATHHQNHELYNNGIRYCPRKWKDVNQELANQLAINNKKPEDFE